MADLNVAQSFARASAGMKAVAYQAVRYHRGPDDGVLQSDDPILRMTNFHLRKLSIVPTDVWASFAAGGRTLLLEIVTIS